MCDKVNHLPVVSVIIPVFNAANFLKEAIDSITSQTYKNLDIIICYDQSSDESLSIIQQSMSEDPRIRLSSGINRGLVRSLNDGIKLASGKYIVRMDADDISVDTRIEKQVTFMEENQDIGVCGSWVEVLFEDGQKRTWKTPLEHEKIKPHLLFSVPFAHPSVIMRNYFGTAFPFYDEDFNTVEDYKLWCDLLLCTKFANYPEILLTYRYHESSLSKTADSDIDTRYESMYSVFITQLNSLGVENSHTENYCHFILTSNDRLSRTSLKPDFVVSYIYKLLRQNDKTLYFQGKNLKLFLLKKLLVYLVLQIKQKNIFNFIQILKLKNINIISKICLD